MTQHIYLDYNATTRLSAAASERMVQLARDAFGNPSSLHWAGVGARRALDDARRQVAALLDASAAEVVFTSGGTEADVAAINAIIMRARSAGQVAHIAATSAEHHAIIYTLRQAEALQLAQVTWLEVDAYGALLLDSLDAAIARGLDGLCTMWANNETGTLTHLEAIADRLNDGETWWHCDAVQAAGKVPIRLNSGPAARITTLALAAHKLHGPRGVGAIFVRRGTPFTPLLPGGAQEGGRRSGTENVPGIAGFAIAAQEAQARLDAGEARRLAELRDHLQRELLTRFPGSIVHGHPERRLPNTLSIALRLEQGWADGQALMLALAERGVAISTGAACAAGDRRPSHVLTAMNVPPLLAHATLRLSLGDATTAAEIATVLDALQTLRDDAECLS